MSRKRGGPPPPLPPPPPPPLDGHVSILINGERDGETGHHRRRHRLFARPHAHTQRASHPYISIYVHAYNIYIHNVIRTFRRRTSDRRHLYTAHWPLGPPPRHLLTPPPTAHLSTEFGLPHPLGPPPRPPPPPPPPSSLRAATLPSPS